ncbi:hypothetical protein EV586_103309 [Tumebacillus sp. BK434]|uniref:PH domain-containing protein n=1 Tax=Tumebacillus sp. BK434 TaxID=2512169 RepID=UPI0010500ADA|nr:PH domain-containing protein [Tumebacillus sp. BK434]TCP55656.1 hypothetical protein EV586_103309 [Tumebacillus sp. BK434]
MRNPPALKVDPNAVSIWRIKAALSSLFYGLVPLAYFFLSKKLEQLPLWGFWSLLTLAVLIYLFEVLLVPVIRYRTLRYEITAEEVYLQAGVFNVRRSLIPMNRVQHVETAQGMLLRAYSLANVTVYTAAGKHQIPALQLQVADDLRNRIAEFAKVVDDDDV